MPTDEEILAAIDAAFMGAHKPEHFMEYIGDPECTEHNELLRTRDRDSLQIEDVGNIGWEPLSYCWPEGLAYYMPSLARFALASPTDQFGWYGDTLYLHLSRDEASNDFRKHCSPAQRRAVAALLRHLGTLFLTCEHRTENWEFEQCAQAWWPALDGDVAWEGPFFHGTKANLQVGDLLAAGFRSNYDHTVVMNHIYFTALSKGAGLAAEMAKGDGRPRVYIVEPQGEFENDPNVTDKKFPGNPTRSYRSRQPLKIIGELETWEPFDPVFIQNLRSRVEAGMGEIIN